MSPIELIASAIATQEGYYAPGNTLPKQNLNPGDLRASPLIRKKDSHGFVIFQSESEGFMSLLVQILLYAQKGFTLRQAINAYAPPTGADGGNDTTGYLANVSKWTGIDPDTKLSSLFTFKQLP